MIGTTSDRIHRDLRLAARFLTSCWLSSSWSTRCPTTGPAAAVGDESVMRLWNSASNRLGWASYLGSADPLTAVPTRRDDLTGLAPVWIGVGDCDLFLDEGLRYGDRLRAAGVDCDTDVITGAFHGFDLVLPKAGVSVAFFDMQVAALRQALL